MAAKMATIVGDVTGLQQRHHPQNIPHLVEKIEGFPLKVKSFPNTATYQKRVPRWRYEFACTFEVQRYFDVSEKHQLNHVTSLDSKKLRVFSLPRNRQFGLRSIAGLNSSNKYVEFNRR